METAESSGIGCPQCGGPLDFREGSRITLCGACQTLLAVTGGAGTNRYVLEETLDLAGARSTARRFLATAGVDESVVTQLHFQGGELCYLPFWRLRGVALGWQWLERDTAMAEESPDEQGMTRGREVKGLPEQLFEILALPVEYSSPACDLSPFGLTGIATVSSVLTLKGVSYERLARRGTVFDPTKGADQLRREAMGLLRERSLPQGTVRHEERLTLSGEQLALIYYPVWKLGFLREERLYPVVVDAVNGRLLKARFSGRSRIRLAWPLATVTLLIYACFLQMTVGILATLLFLGWLASRGELSPAGVARHFFLLVVPGEEVEHG
jgi:hypothetical protein